ncbi:MULTISPECIES: response regulator transcription factor [Dysgonomonas]|uniref:response regulator transcription factor n=1 Tax=Dysgonomonas TaxID=156973 RepID=UPI00092B80D4|nr:MULTISPECIES: response regulator transcription factor [Dysgonomonas]MBN9300914.1 response regulator transcription factor [Dysgonomonas mossii]OJX58053.1 MAG: DNA-binding response regulator [Dysgonomonas sp. 37-18]
MGNKILIVDDEKDICEILEFNLSNEGFDVELAYSAEEALKKLNPDFSLILLDVMMGGMSGYKMAEKLRKEGNNIPIVFLTAKDTENDMLTGFSVGGDDYISKPFSIKEVIARIKAVVKRLEVKKNPKESTTELTFAGIVINMDKKELTVDGEKVALTKTEFEILALLATNVDKVFSREDIIQTVWRETPYITERTVDVHIARLRKKMGEYSSLITNRSGYGYRFNIGE